MRTNFLTTIRLPGAKTVPLYVVAAAGFAFLLGPIAVIVAASFTAKEFVTFPPQGLTWHWYRAFLGNFGFVSAVRLSLLLATATAVTATMLGTMAAMALARWDFPGRGAVNALFLSPLIVPQIVIGIVLLQFLSVVGIGRTFAALLIGHTIATLPYVVRTVQAVLVGFDIGLEEAAQDLGASRWRTFLHVTLPLIKPGVIAGALFAFVTSWINVEISIFLVASVNAPLPVQIFNYIQYNFDPLITAVSALSVYVALGMLLVVDWLVGIDKFSTMPQA
jgi:putative spermidine/putrescine transport system permease protein